MFVLSQKLLNHFRLYEKRRRNVTFSPPVVQEEHQVRVKYFYLPKVVCRSGNFGKMGDVYNPFGLHTWTGG